MDAGGRATRTEPGKDLIAAHDGRVGVDPVIAAVLVVVDVSDLVEVLVAGLELVGAGAPGRQEVRAVEGVQLVVAALAPILIPERR